MSEYTQGVCQDGAAILKDGQQMTVEEILAALRNRSDIDINMICHAYEAGFGMGADHRGLPNPYAEGTEQRIAWDIGYKAGKDRHPKTEGADS